MQEESKEMNFVEMLKDHHEVIFNKSQLPEMRRRKSAALTAIKMKCREMLNIELTEAQITKKIINMKNRLKTKIDLKKTGNIPIILKDWERDLLDMLQGETNPTIARIPGGRKCGFNTVAIDELSTEETEFESHGAALASSGEDVLDTPVSPGTTVDDTPGTSKKPSAISRNKKRALEEMEDEFTKELSFQELQRYFLLKQVKILNMQENEIAKHERLMQLEEEKSKKKEILLNLQIEKLLWEKEVRERQQGDSQYRLEAEDSSQFFHL